MNYLELQNNILQKPLLALRTLCYKLQWIKALKKIGPICIIIIIINISFCFFSRMKGTAVVTVINWLQYCSSVKEIKAGL